MCSTEYEMLVSHSPPIFTHSPTTGGFLKEYAALRFGVDAFPRTSSRNPHRPFQQSCSIFPTKPNKISPNFPRRPCLVRRPTTGTIQVIEDPLSPTKLKKKVVFADDKGMSLTQVRVMTEPSNVPPLWNCRFPAEVSQSLIVEPIPVEETWEITFPQPASDYVVFRKRLDYEKLSLENVIVKEAEKLIQGTIKVRNEVYEKEVFVRTSVNDWESHEDSYCTFVSNNSNLEAAYVLYDTFAFSIPLPVKSNKIEFCVCFKYGGNEYWDNNHHKNYIIEKKFKSVSKPSSSEDFIKMKDNSILQPISKKFAEAAYAEFDSWSEFASWTHLENSSPYW